MGTIQILVKVTIRKIFLQIM